MWRTGALELTHELGHHRRVVAAHVVEEALEVGGDGDVHRGRDRLGDARARVVTRAEVAVEDVVGVGRHDEPLDGQPHLLGVEAREDVAEVARGHGEGDLGRGRARRRRVGHLEVGVHVVDDLREDACPVDAVHRGEAVMGAEGRVVEERLDVRLAGSGVRGKVSARARVSESKVGVGGEGVGGGEGWG